jgi:hypothetical protein
MIKTITGDVTWNVTFDATAKAAGATDCLYTRHYEGVEDRSAPWLCPSCEIMFNANVTVTAGQTDCYAQVSMKPPATVEWIGYGNGTWWRAPQGPTTDQGMVKVMAPDITFTNSVMGQMAPVGGTLDFAVEGALKLGEKEGDPFNGWVPPATYACGWPKANPPAYTGKYSLAKGQTIPDGLFRDACDEVVRVHDFKGSYFLIDMSAMDCPPCQQMATEEEAFVADMKASGVDVHIITLLAPSLSNPFGNTTKKQLGTWISTYKLTSPILADRSWGLAMFDPVFTPNTGYPSFVIVRPDLTILDYQTGYGGFTDVKTAILADKGP